MLGPRSIHTLTRDGRDSDIARHRQELLDAVSVDRVVGIQEEKPLSCRLFRSYIPRRSTVARVGIGNVRKYEVAGYALGLSRLGRYFPERSPVRIVAVGGNADRDLVHDDLPRESAFSDRTAHPSVVLLAFDSVIPNPPTSNRHQQRPTRWARARTLANRESHPLEKRHSERLPYRFVKRPLPALFVFDYLSSISHFGSRCFLSSTQGSYLLRPTSRPRTMKRARGTPSEPMVVIT